MRRYSLTGAGTWQAVEAIYPIVVAAGADGIEVGPGNQLYVTMYNSGEVVRLDPTAPSGTNAALVASGLVNPFGMATGTDGALYVASQDARVLRIAPDGTQRSIALPAGFAAWQVAKVGNDIWVTDSANARTIRIRNAGRPAAGAAGRPCAYRVGAHDARAHAPQAGRQAEGRRRRPAGVGEEVPVQAPPDADGPQAQGGRGEGQLRSRSRSARARRRPTPPRSSRCR